MLDRGITCQHLYQYLCVSIYLVMSLTSFYSYFSYIPPSSAERIRIWFFNCRYQSCTEIKLSLVSNWKNGVWRMYYIYSIYRHVALYITVSFSFLLFFFFKFQCFMFSFPMCWKIFYYYILSQVIYKLEERFWYGSKFLIVIVYEWITIVNFNLIFSSIIRYKIWSIISPTKSI